MTLAVGIDVGGTKIAAGLVDTVTGRVLTTRRVPMRPEAGAAAMLDACARVAGEVAARRDVHDLGFGVCELVDRSGEIRSAFTIDWRGVDIAKAFSDFARVRIESDVRAAALAESRFGAAAGADSALYLIIGTGIASSLVLEGMPLAGARGNAIVVGAPAVEELASGRGLAARWDVERAEEVFADPQAAPLIVEAAARLGAAVAAIVNATDPSLVVFGGGLGLLDRYRELVIEAARPLIWAPGTAALEMVPGLLGAEAGVIGAATYAVLI